MRSLIALCLGCAFMTSGGDARAQSPAEREMDTAMRSYFAGEKSAGVGALLLGLSAGGLGAGLLADDSELGVGMAVPLIAAGSLQAIIGTVLLARTGGQLADLRALHERDPVAYRAEELPRMENVNFWFGVYKAVWFTFIGAGAAAVVYGTIDDRPGFVGAGLGLTAQASATLVFDVMAEGRAERYSDAIREHTPTLKAAFTPGFVSLHGTY
jgi:hypothetical protein